MDLEWGCRATCYFTMRLTAVSQGYDAIAFNYEPSKTPSGFECLYSKAQLADAWFCVYYTDPLRTYS